ncbi:MAG: hypothetical protein SFU98_22155 [Leptospiraceae bacterium]|nr:hypothetical protein [Leptospiraceae bacterium]
MKPEVPFNPFEANEEFSKRTPEEMSIEELEVLLYGKRLALKLDMERLYKKANTSKVLIDIFNGLGIPELIDKYLSAILSSNDTNKTPKQ